MLRGDEDLQTVDEVGGRLRYFESGRRVEGTQSNARAGRDAGQTWNSDQIE